MITKRLIVCLDVQDGRVVKGVHFKDLRDLGDPVELASRYEREGADEIVYLDISASHEGRATLWDLARATAERLFVPLTIGGGVRTADDVGKALRAGADKVGLNTAAVEQPDAIRAASDRFGAQCVVVSIDAAWDGSAWRVFTKGGRQPTGLDAVAWAEEAVRRGAGELLVTSIDRDGVRTGYDLALTGAIARAVDVPVIASGGAGTSAHVVEALTEADASAALVAGILHDGVTTVGQLKAAMSAAGIETRRV
ncbi:MAG: imidazole glycerol phosphate synthase subunit HisF [Gemmatimonadales bacterium]|nr:imidazole glycerol phosphate synthase subunit HisF [Gemmatimonadales bacterium]